MDGEKLESIWLAGAGRIRPGLFSGTGRSPEFAGGLAWILGPFDALASLGILSTMPCFWFILHAR